MNNVTTAIIMIIVLGLVLNSGELKDIPRIEINGKLTVDFQEPSFEEPRRAGDSPGIAID